MTTWNDITDAELDPDSPITTQLKTRERDNLLAMAEQSSGAPSLPSTRIYYCEEQKAASTASATNLIAATWVPRRDLVEMVDTLAVDGTAAGSISGGNNDTINLPAGSYWVQASAVFDPAAAENSKLRLQNTTDASTEVIGTSVETDATEFVEMTLSGYFQITDTKALQLQHIVGNSASTGGQAVNHGTEVYSRIAFWRLDLTGT